MDTLVQNMIRKKLIKRQLKQNLECILAYFLLQSTSCALYVWVGT